MHKRFLFALIAVLAPALLPGSARAQAPPFLAQWPASVSRVAVDATDHLYGIGGFTTIYKFATSGALLGSWDPGGVIPTIDIAADAGSNIYGLYLTPAPIAPSNIMRFTGNGDFVASWFYPYAKSIAVDASGNVYVALGRSGGDWTVRKFSSYGDSLAQWEARGCGLGCYEGGITLDATGNVYVLSCTCITKLASNGEFVAQWALPSGRYLDIAVDADANVYVADYDNNHILIFNSAGEYLGQWGTNGTGPGQFAGPSGIAVDASGNVYVADSGNNRIQKFGYLPVPTTSTSWGRIKILYR